MLYSNNYFRNKVTYKGNVHLKKNYTKNVIHDMFIGS